MILVGVSRITVLLKDYVRSACFFATLCPREGYDTAVRYVCWIPVGFLLVCQGRQ